VTALVVILAVGMLLAVLWLAASLGRQSAKSYAAKETVRRVQEIQEIENEVQALDRDTLKSRARHWVRGANK
jgi:flagellar basal body-associated protein FliL